MPPQATPTRQRSRRFVLRGLFLAYCLLILLWSLKTIHTLDSYNEGQFTEGYIFSYAMFPITIGMIVPSLPTSIASLALLFLMSWLLRGTISFETRFVLMWAVITLGAYLQWFWLLPLKNRHIQASSKAAPQSTAPDGA